MKKIKFLAIFAAVFLSGIGCATEQMNKTANGNQMNENANAAVKNIEQAAPGKTERVFDNEFAEVMRVNLEPDQQLPPHKGNRRVIYSLSDYKIKFVQDGQADEKSFQTGDAHYHAGGAHSIMNTGTTRAEFVVFERRAAALPTVPNAETEKTLSDAAGKNVKELLNNNDFQVLEVNLPPKEKLPAHFGLNRAVYSLSSYTIRFDANNAEAPEQTFNPGDVHFHDANIHTAENVGATPARFLIVKFKK